MWAQKGSWSHCVCTVSVVLAKHIDFSIDGFWIKEHVKSRTEVSGAAEKYTLYPKISVKRGMGQWKWGEQELYYSFARIWKFVFPWPDSCWNPISHCDGLGGGTLGRCLGHEGGALRSGINAVTKKMPQSPGLSCEAHWTRNRLSPDTCQHHDLGLPSSRTMRTMRKKRLLFISHQPVVLCYSSWHRLRHVCRIMGGFAAFPFCVLPSPRPPYRIVWA